MTCIVRNSDFCAIASSNKTTLKQADLFGGCIKKCDSAIKIQQRHEWSVDDFDKTEIQHGSSTKSDGAMVYYGTVATVLLTAHDYRYYWGVHSSNLWKLKS